MWLERLSITTMSLGERREARGERRELGHEHLIDIGLEGLAVDRAVEDHRGDEAGEAQPSHEGRRLPVMGWTPPDGIDVPEWWC